MADGPGTWFIWISILFLLFPPEVHGRENQPYYLRSQSPFLHIFGLPAPEGGQITPAGNVESRLELTVANHADRGSSGNEVITLDGESHYADVVLRYGLNDRWALGIDLPFVSHREGVLDNLIEAWHDTFGLPDRDLEGPRNHLSFIYSRNGVDEVSFTEAGSGIGDVRLVSAWQLKEDKGKGRSLALRGVVKLPTGDPDRLLGSGAMDLALSLEVTDAAAFSRRDIDLFGQVGVLVTGRGDVLGDRQQRAVSFASGGLVWPWTRTIDLQMQLSFQDGYFDSRLSELGGYTADLAIGTNFHLRKRGLRVSIGFIEDLIFDATPDFAVFMSIKCE